MDRVLKGRGATRNPAVRFERLRHEAVDDGWGGLEALAEEPGPRTEALIDRGVIPDFREPDVVRLGMSPLTTRFVDVYDGITTVAELVRGLAG